MGSRWLSAALVGAAFGFALGTPAALAQVAAPMLAPSTFSSDNPAAIKWGAPSRFGFGVSSGRQVEQPGNVKTDFTGANVGLRLVGERFAFGVEQWHLADQTAGLKDVDDQGSAAIALQTGDMLAWGIGYNAREEALDTQDTKSTEPTFGVSIRLGEVWFIGLVAGRESVDLNDTSIPLKFSADRSTLRYGVGFRRGGSVLVHIEAFGGHSDTLKDQALNFGSQDFTGGTLEFAFGPVLIGGSTRRITYSQSGTDYTTITTGDIGYVPRQGFALTLHYERTYTKYDFAAVGLNYNNREIGGVQLTWQF